MTNRKEQMDLFQTETPKEETSNRVLLKDAIIFSPPKDLRPEPFFAIWSDLNGAPKTRRSRSKTRRGGQNERS